MRDYEEDKRMLYEAFRESIDTEELNTILEILRTIPFDEFDDESTDEATSFGEEEYR